MPKRVATQVEQDRARVTVGDAANDEGSVGQQWPVPGGAGIGRGVTAYRHRVGEEPSAEQAARLADLELAGPAIVFPTGDFGRTLPELRGSLPVEATLGRVAGVVERGEGGLEAKDRHGADPLLRDPLQVARSYPLERDGSVGMSGGLPMRAQVVVGPLAPTWSESDHAALDGDQAVPLGVVEGLEQIGWREPGDLDGELDIEPVAQHRQGPNHPGHRTDVAIHRDESSPVSTGLRSPPDVNGWGAGTPSV